MSFDNAQGYQAAAGMFWPSTGCAGDFQIPPQVAKVGQPKRLRLPATGFGQDCQYGVSLPPSMTIVDHRN